ncbi:MAG: GNAT family N-acetyltransferase [Kangiellaceae bacterium]|nr:GNAT family N-acetyltransferase [Kangiellaceae bacterium]
MLTEQTAFNPQPVLLERDAVTLRPLKLSDASGFFKAGNFAELWRWVVPNHCSSIEATEKWIEQSLTEQQEGNHIPFVIIDNQSNTIIGSTRYCSIRKNDRGIEIGFTFITPQFQQTHVNTMAKFMLLENAFEKLGAVRVEFKTNEKNNKSRNAIGRIGATFEGVLRNHRILPDGDLRNTAIFSITDQEWPDVKRSLQQTMIRSN